MYRKPLKTTTPKRKPKAETVPANQPMIKMFLEIFNKPSESSATPSRECKEIQSKCDVLNTPKPEFDALREESEKLRKGQANEEILKLKSEDVKIGGKLNTLKGRKTLKTPQQNPKLSEETVKASLKFTPSKILKKQKEKIDKLKKENFKFALNFFKPKQLPVGEVKSEIINPTSGLEKGVCVENNPSNKSHTN